MDNLIHKLGPLLASLIGNDFKYVKSRFALIRVLDDGSQAITVDLLPASKAGFFKLALHAHIRLSVLEDQYGPFHPFLNAKDRKTHSTLVVNCDSLFADKTLAGSFQACENNLDEIASKYAEAIKEDVFPFFKKYYSVENLVMSFEQENSKLWITSDRNTRNLVLLSAYALESKWDDFEKVSSDYLEYCDRPFAQAYKPLAQAVVAGLKGTS